MGCGNGERICGTEPLQNSELFGDLEKIAVEKFLQLLKESFDFIDNQTIIIICLTTIGLCLVFQASGELAMQIINSIVSGLLGMAMGRQDR